MFFIEHSILTSVHSTNIHGKHSLNPAPEVQATGHVFQALLPARVHPQLA